MNAKSVLIAVAAAFATTAALADDITMAPEAKSIKTRAEVVAEVLKARAAGQLIRAGEFLPVMQAQSLKSRDQVRGEVLAARASGTLLKGGEIGAE